MQKRHFRWFSLAVLVTVLLSLSAIPAFARGSEANANASVCNKVEFVSDVTVKDNSTFAPNERFTKTWRLRNAGTCNWNKNYALVFVGGADLARRHEVRLESKVRPGQTVDVSVRMRAPSKTGSYQSYWMMRDDNGRRFGTGSNASSSFWTRIKVSTQPAVSVVHSFTSRYCGVLWRSSAGAVACPSPAGSTGGSVNVVRSPILENGFAAGGSALVTIPQQVSGGQIRGRYEPIKIQKGDHFQATIGCLHGEQSCDVTFELRYRVIGGGRSQSLGTWHQTYDGKVKSLDIDLSRFAGDSVRFYLVVTANNNSADNAAVWASPVIVR